MRQAVLLVLLAFLLVALTACMRMLPFGSTAQSAETPPAVQNTPEGAEDNTDVYSIAVEGPYTYLTVGSRLMVLNISQPNLPQVLGQTDVLWESTRDMVLQGRFAYVSEVAGLHVIDVQDPTTPKSVGFFGEIASWGVAVSGQYAYLCAGYALIVLDISDPAHPREVGRADWEPHAPGFAWDVAVNGSYAYVADGERGLRIYNVAEPSRPAEVSFYETTQNILSVSVQENYAYIGASAAGFRVLDVSDPSNPFEAGVYETAEPSTTEYFGPGRAEGIEIEEGYAYVILTEKGLQIVDVSNPTAPMEEGLWESPGVVASLTRGVDVEGDYAYILVSQSGLHILDLTNPAQPTEVGLYQPARLTPDSIEESENR